MKNGRRGAYLMHPSGGWGNQTLLKDCGIIPYMLHKNHGFHSVMVGKGKFEPEKFPYLEKYVRGLELEFLPEYTTESRINYIDSHAGDIDLLILHGAYLSYVPIVERYRQVRPDGKIYLATDMNIGWASKTPHDTPAWKNFLRSCDVVAASCRAVQKYLSAKWGVPVELIRNGWYNFPQVSFDNLFEQKENIILTVGRIGSDQKRNEDLLAAFAKVAAYLPDWSVRLVGTVKEEFKPYIEKYFELHPELKERVIFTGLIEDKTELANEYKRAKIFCLTSTFEGAPNVMAEALFAGNFMVFSSFNAASDGIDNNKCGRVFPIADVDALAQTFLEVCSDEKILSEGGRHAVEYARQNFDAEHIVAKLYYLLYGGDEK